MLRELVDEVAQFWAEATDAFSWLCLAAGVGCVWGLFWLLNAAGAWM